ncbi:2-dehydro-3-deoxygalactonokinase [Pseudaquabacterium pictum]|uniref:MFS transporter n=1 Tax=Pseudaquabacterium pictum TaxID=2315236 RepID=A0A480ASG6_9BURK|nr:MFS transporter [Rubrivivax pictus]
MLAQHAAPRGLLSVAPGGWQAAFDAEFGAWQAAHPGLPCLLAGMVGSRQGWAEAPYAACPAGLADIARQLRWLQPGCLAIVPGLSCENDGVPDVLRGEETQVFGALQALPDAGGAHTLVLPGTHSKWMQVDGGRVRGFRTHVTGETYALLRQQSILARMLPAADGDLDADAFDAGVARAQQPGGLLHHLFSVRTLALFDRATGAALASRLSGLLIGEELRAQALPPGQPVTVLGSAGLALRYQRALAAGGHPVRLAPDDATWQGLLAVARAAALVSEGTLSA